MTPCGSLWYDGHVLPLLIDFASSLPVISGERRKVFRQAAGRPLDIGSVPAWILPLLPAKGDSLARVVAAAQVHRLVRPAARAPECARFAPAATDSDRTAALSRRRREPIAAASIPWRAGSHPPRGPDLLLRHAACRTRTHGSIIVLGRSARWPQKPRRCDNYHLAQQPLAEADTRRPDGYVWSCGGRSRRGCSRSSSAWWTAPCAADRGSSKRQLRQRVRCVFPQQVSVVPLDHLQARPRELRDGERVQLVQRDQIRDRTVP